MVPKDPIRYDLHMKSFHWPSNFLEYALIKFLMNVQHDVVFSSVICVDSPSCAAIVVV
jgi:hypothetical protein